MNSKGGRPPIKDPERRELVHSLRGFRLQVDLVLAGGKDEGLSHRAAKGLAKAMERNNGELGAAIEEVLARWA